ncbi:hypothetical protein [Lacrimispora algidixylanolytica]|uniref:Uncharacterized protein n=1 Tax=Lacrimispora algidixylanolytica TaxID=94868 RepID=A0A419T7X8_9FIRM|nr:hypothetical protein [Lacrimispora algidixylanolytica]RKD33555.1 hypothetical protein BET01_13515 [Lacrimispora algidixylanolytica]
MGIMKLFMQKILRYRNLETQKEETSYEEQETKPVTGVEDPLHFSLKKIAEEFAFREGSRVFQSELLKLAGENKPEISDVEEVGQKIHTEIKRIQSGISLLAGNVQKAEEIRNGLKLLEDIETELKSIYPYEEEELDQDILKESKTVEHLEKLSKGLSVLLNNKELLETFGDLTVQLKAIDETVKELIQSYEKALSEEVVSGEAVSEDGVSEEGVSEEVVNELSQSAAEVFSSFQELLPLISSGIEEFTSALVRDNENVLGIVDDVEQFAALKSELIPLIVLNERLNSSLRAAKMEEDK